MLPCAAKHCSSKMSLIRESESFLYYACNTKCDEHTFRYNIANEKWEKVITRGKLLLGYNVIGSKTAKKLEKAGIKTVPDLAKRSPKHLSEKTGVSLALVCKWIIEANKITEQSEATSIEPRVIECKT